MDRGCLRAFGTGQEQMIGRRLDANRSSMASAKVFGDGPPCSSLTFGVPVVFSVDAEGGVAERADGAVLVGWEA